MKFAVIKTGGKQLLVTEGETVLVEKIDAKSKSKIKFDQVLLIFDKEKLLIGTPVINNAVVNGEVIEQIKSKKIKISKFKAKSRYRRTTGHRQLLTKVKILTIAAPKK